jgi:phosphoglycolate phosphatase
VTRAEGLASAAPITLACLDMAGTTVDDGEAVLDAFAVAMEVAGLTEGSAERIAADQHVVETMGQSKVEVFRHLFGGDDARAAAANETFELTYETMVASGGVGSMYGVDELFAALRDAGIRVCLTTGFSPRTRDAIVDTLGWRTSVDLVLSPADAGRGRPYPDMVLTAVLRLEVEDVRQVAVAGDTTSDLVAGTRAGASIVAGVLTGAHDRATLAAAPHTHILDSIEGLAPLVLSPAR